MSYKTAAVIANAEKQVNDLLGKEVSITSELFNAGKLPEIRYTVSEKCTNELDIMRKGIAEFSLTQLPGCCGVCVSYHAFVSHHARGKGLGTLLCSIRKDLAKALGYGCMLCTDVANNKPQQRVLAKNGWEDIHTFTNPRTNNEVNIHIVDL